MSNVPKLRFKEFTDEWENRKFKDIVKINQGLQIAISERHTEIRENRLFYITNEFLKKESDKKYYIENPPSNVVCNESDLLMTRTGNTGQVVTGVFGVFHNNFFKIDYNSNTHNKMFLYYILKSFKIQKNIIRLAGTSTIPDLNHSDFYSINISFPQLQEQEKIGSFLSLVDKKISLQTEKVKALKDYKKGLMQKIFSKELRFKDENGNEFPEWEEKEFKELFFSISTKPYQIKSSEVESYGEFKVVDQGKEKICGYTNKKENLFCDVPIIIYGDHTTNIKFRNEEFVIGADGTKLLKNKNKFDNLNYLFYALDFNNIKPEGYKRHFSILSKISLIISVSYEEQEKIANLLSSIDLKIEKEQENLDLLECYKKGLLQQMFV